MPVATGSELSRAREAHVGRFVMNVLGKEVQRSRRRECLSEAEVIIDA
jgi:hypothetical protein